MTLWLCCYKRGFMRYDSRCQCWGLIYQSGISLGYSTWKVRRMWNQSSISLDYSTWEVRRMWTRKRVLRRDNIEKIYSIIIYIEDYWQIPSSFLYHIALFDFVSPGYVPSWRNGWVQVSQPEVFSFFQTKYLLASRAPSWAASSFSVPQVHITANKWNALAVHQLTILRSLKIPAIILSPQKNCFSGQSVLRLRNISCYILHAMDLTYL